MFTSMQQVIKPLMLLCQAADHVLANCWLSRRSTCFSLLSSRTSSSSRPMAVTRFPAARRWTSWFLRSTLLFDLYRDHTTKQGRIYGGGGFTPFPRRSPPVKWTNNLVNLSSDHISVSQWHLGDKYIHSNLFTYVFMISPNELHSFGNLLHAYHALASR